MKMLRFKITILLLFIGFGVINAQKIEKKSTERFNVNKDVVIDVNTRYTDIEIETWDKNEVVIEAYISLNGETNQKVIDDFLNKWDFKALGNKSTIEISSKSLGLIDIHSFDFDSPNYEVFHLETVNDALENLTFVIPEIPELPEIPEIEMFIVPEVPELPGLPELPELPETPTEFDFDTYKKDKSYLERWKKENKDVIGKNAKIRVGKNSISINSKDDNSSYRWRITTEGQHQHAEEIEERLEEARVRREERHKEMKEKMKERQAELKERQQELKIRMKERSKERKLALVKRQEAHERRVKEHQKRRIEVRDILKKREKSKIKRIIKIKAPKDAKFNMNVKYGSMSFPK